MSIDLTKLAGQGRAFSAARAFTDTEHEAVQTLVASGLSRTVAADYVRNGIMTPEDVETAQKKGIKTKSVAEITEEAVNDVKEENAKVLKKSSKKNEK